VSRLPIPLYVLRGALAAAQKCNAGCAGRRTPPARRCLSAGLLKMLLLRLVLVELRRRCPEERSMRAMMWEFDGDLRGTPSLPLEAPYREQLVTIGVARST
jgi:hypothetical protein